MELKLSRRKPDPHVQALCQWARDNEPLLTFRSDQEIEKVVRAARTEKAGLVTAVSVSFVFVAAYVTWHVTDELFGPAPSWWQSAVASALAGAAIAVIMRFVGDLIMQHEISRLARGTYGHLSHE